MTLPAVPAQGSTSWYPYAQGLDGAVRGLPNTYAPLLPQFHGIRYKAYGHSFGQDASGHTWVGGLFPSRLRDLMHADTTLYANNHVGGDRMKDTSQRALGTVAPWTSGDFGLVTLMGAINDIGFGHGDAQSVVGYQQGLRTFLSVVRSGSRAAGTFTGAGWTLGSGATGSSGGNIRYTTTAGNSWSATFTATDATVMLAGFYTAIGALYTVTVDGAAYTSGDSSFQAVDTANDFATDYGPLPIQLRNLGPGSHTVVVTHNGGTGTRTLSLDVTPLLLWSTTPPQTLIIKATLGTTAGYSVYTSPPTDTDVITWNGYADGVVAEFPADGSIAVADPIGDGWSKTTMTATDGLHPNDRGQAFIAASAVKALAAMPYRLGMSKGV